MSHHAVLKRLRGKWSGTCQTWFEPGVLADSSSVSGEFVDVLEGRFLRHAYKGSIQGKPHQGEELIAFNSITQRFESSWIDDFHMSGAIMFSQGPEIENGFELRGEFDVAPSQPRWGWRTVFVLNSDTQLTITSYNIDPQGQEAKAVKTSYHAESSGGM